jgi:hypothetical protein
MTRGFLSFAFFGSSQAKYFTDVGVAQRVPTKAETDWLRESKSRGEELLRHLPRALDM